jgi:hypothetical protein
MSDKRWVLDMMAGRFGTPATSTICCNGYGTIKVTIVKHEREE